MTLLDCYDWWDLAEVLIVVFVGSLMAFSGFWVMVPWFVFLIVEHDLKLRWRKLSKDALDVVDRQERLIDFLREQAKR